MTLNHEEATQPVTRGEFEGFRDQVLSSIRQLSAKLDEQSRGRQWSLGTVLAIVAVVGTPLIFTVRNLYQGETTARVLADHLDFADRRSGEIAVDVTALRERARALEARAVEEETQHKWVADVMNVIHDYEDRMSRTYCTVCQNSRLEVPSMGYRPLAHVGEATREPAR